MTTRSVRAQWTNAAIFAGMAVLWFVMNRDGAGSLVMSIFLVGLAVASTPLLKRTSVSHRAAVDSADSVVIYHRPGCSYCIRMKALLGTTGSKATWVDIWADDQAAEFVQSVNNGNETVPTVVIDGQAHTNPSPSLVRAALS